MAETINPIRILAVNFPALIQEAMSALLEKQAAGTVVPQLATCGTILSAITSDHSELRQPNLLLFDLDNCPHQQLDCLIPLRSSAPATRILGLAGALNRRLFRTAVCRGVRGVILKTDSTAMLLEAIRRVHHGQSWLSREITSQLLTESWLISPSLPDEGTVSRISKREREVLASLGEGFSDQQIADRLSISIATVRSHLTSVRLKLEVKSRTELAIYSHRQH
jgi:DNA-binding NarL/FixJ family response regulator